MVEKIEHHSNEVGGFATPTLAEADRRVRVLPACIAPVYRPIQLSGAAYPVVAAPGDNLSIHLAIAEAPPECVLVVCTGNHTQSGFFGEVLMEAARARGIRGLVTDGSVRDTRALRDHGFPVFCAGIAIAGTTKNVPGICNRTVTIMQVEVQPGDFVVGDDDGVVIVPRDAASEIAQKAQARVEKEAKFIAQIRGGALTVDLFSLKKGATRPDA